MWQQILTEQPPDVETVSGLQMREWRSAMLKSLVEGYAVSGLEPRLTSNLLPL